jgi:glycosyltransferase involved in cell wall biosynthesis
MKKPVITVLMTVYNGERYLSESIESILCQTYSDFEFVIIDDASIDKSRKIILSFNDPRIKFINNNRNQGQTASLNNGLKISKGKYIARIDQDDISHKTRLEIQYNYLEQNPNISIVGSWAYSIDSKGKYRNTIIHPTKNDFIKESISCGCPLSHSSAFFNCERIIAVGGYPNKLSYAMDWGLWIECAIMGYKFSNINKPLVSIRTHNKSATSSKELNLIKLSEMCCLLDQGQLIENKKSTVNYSIGLKQILYCKMGFYLFRSMKISDSFYYLKNIIKENPFYLILALVIKLSQRLSYNNKINKIEPIRYIK